MKHPSGNLASIAKDDAGLFRDVEHRFALGMKAHSNLVTPAKIVDHLKFGGCQTRPGFDVDTGRGSPRTVCPINVFEKWTPGSMQDRTFFRFGPCSIGEQTLDL